MELTLKEIRDEEFIKENQDKYFCQCGCREVIKITHHHRLNGIPKYICGHNTIGNKNPMKTPEIKRRHKLIMVNMFSGANNAMKRPDVKKKKSICSLNQFKDGMPEETRKNISKSLSGHKQSDTSIKKRIKSRRENNKEWFSKKTIKRMQKSHPTIIGKNNANWNNGSSVNPYGREFNKDLKKKIRKRYKNKCVECNQSEKKIKYNLYIHHIDYNKKNNKEDNLIPLCRSCHAQTNFKRNNWLNYFKTKIICNV